MATDDADALSVQKVTFAYPRSGTILDVPSLRIAQGESVFLHGPSGSGKTTLLSLIAGVLRPSTGSLEVLGHDLGQMSAGARDRLRGANIGYIFQGFNLVPYLSVEDNIALPCRLHKQRLQRIRSASVHEEVARLARCLDIHAHLQDPVTRLSVGQQQRVAIARALIGAPPLLIADEPTSSLDTDRRDRFLELLRELLNEADADGQRPTLLFVSHDRSLARHFDRSLGLTDLNLASKPFTEAGTA